MMENQKTVQCDNHVDHKVTEDQVHTIVEIFIFEDEKYMATTRVCNDCYSKGTDLWSLPWSEAKAVTEIDRLVSQI